MGLFSGGNSRTDVSNYNTTQANQLGASDEAITAFRSSVTINETDGGAFDFADNAVNASLNTVDDVVNDALKFAGKNGELLSGSVEDVLRFLDDSGDLTGELISGVVDASYDVVNDSLGVVGDSLVLSADANELMSRGVDRALSWAGDQSKDNLNAILSVVDGAFDRSSDALAAGYKFAGDRSSDVVEISDRSLGFGEGVVSKYFDGVQSIVDGLFQSNKESIAELGQAQSRSIIAVNESTRSDAADTLKTITKWGAGAVMLIGAAMVLKR